MRVPLSWLSDYVDLAGLDAGELAERLTLAGLEVEGIHEIGPLSGVVVGRVLEVAPHPNADRLAICRLDAGDRVYTVVSGAPNLEAGRLVPFAPPGTQLPGGEVREVKLRGVVSEGMILSAADLGLEAKSSGIWNLPAGPEVGAEFAPLIGAPDRVLDLKITSNRPDLLGVYGVAREVAAVFGRSLSELDLEFPEDDPSAEELVRVEIESPDDCPRYVARVIVGVPREASPLWLAARLFKAGMRPLSLMVDVTNYVMLELGHPLHAFDYDRLSGGMIGVRRARRGEVIRTLDGVDRELSEEVLLITDGARPIAIAGVMGGEDTEISDSTSRVLLEAACFSPARIRRSSRYLGLRTEASHRFERGLAPQSAEVASRRACHLLTRLSGVRVARGSVDAYPKPASPAVVPLRERRVTEVLGVEIPPAEVARALESLGLSLSERDDGWEARIPYWRVDLTREIDLVEEVARIYGYDRIPSSPPQVPLRAGDKDPREAFADRVRRIMASLGLAEVYSFGLVPRGEAEVLLKNPQAEGQEGLRKSLLFGLLTSARENLEAQNSGVALFEVGRTFHLEGGEVVEEDRLGVILAGRTPMPLSGKEEYSPAHIKGILDGLLAALRAEGVALGETEADWLHPYRRAGIYSGGRIIGWLGELNRELSEDLPGDVRALALEISLSALREAARSPEHRPLPRFPAARRDLSLVAPEELPEGDVEAAILADELVESCILYDLYRGKGIPEGKRSLTYEVVFRHPQRTLSSEEVDQAVERILARLERLGVELRG